MPTRSNSSASSAATPSKPRWYPTKSQLTDIDATHRTLKQVLDQFYALQDSHDALQKQVAGMASAASPASTSTGSPFPPGSGPSDTKILGLNVAPIDTETLANGATLKFNKAGGNFVVS
jgi:hypothetical protein